MNLYNQIKSHIKKIKIPYYESQVETFKVINTNSIGHLIEVLVRDSIKKPCLYLNAWFFDSDEFTFEEKKEKCEKSMPGIKNKKEIQEISSALLVEGWTILIFDTYEKMQKYYKKFKYAGDIYVCTFHQSGVMLDENT